MLPVPGDPIVRTRPEAGIEEPKSQIAAVGPGPRGQRNWEEGTRHRGACEEKINSNRG